MRIPFTLPLALALFAPAFSQRAVVYFTVEELPVTLESPRLAFCEDGWLTKVTRKDGDRLIWTDLRRSPRDTEPDARVRPLVHTGGQSIDAWWAPAGPGQVAWTSGGRLFIGAIPATGTVTSADAGPAPEGEVSWPTTGTAVTWRSEGSVLVFDGGVTKAFPPRPGRRLVGSPVFLNGALEVAVVTGDAAIPAGAGDTIESLTRETGAWKVLATEENQSVSSLASAPPRPPANAAAPACRKLAWIAAMPGGSRIRFHDAATGTTETIFEQHNAEAVAFTTDSQRVLAVVREPGKNPSAWSVNTFRSGTNQTFVADIIHAGADGELSRPCANAAGYWFMKKVGGGWKAVRAEVK
ncbi:MAG: hypothetical protein HUU15_12615 [Candidatus Brocadiae bacterium]|nr:hypothetical protein [Candidatus Brocadiia bacterium]